MDFDNQLQSNQSYKCVIDVMETRKFSDILITFVSLFLTHRVQSGASIFGGESIELEMMLLSAVNCEITNSRIRKTSLRATLLQCQC